MTTDTKVADLPASESLSDVLREMRSDPHPSRRWVHVLADRIEAALARQDAQAIPEGLEDAIERVGSAEVISHANRQPVGQEAAYEMGAKGAPATEAERLLFEAWMRGHCWALSATWDGKTYLSDAEQGGMLCPRAMTTRRLWAAWRDRAALTAPPAQAVDLEPFREAVRYSSRALPHKDLAEKMTELLALIDQQAGKAGGA